MSEQQPSEPQILLGHEMMGSAGPDKREIDGIQRALIWLKEKRSPDYGWDNDTHMVILAKEVFNEHPICIYITAHEP